MVYFGLCGDRAGVFVCVCVCLLLSKDVCLQESLPTVEMWFVVILPLPSKKEKKTQ